MKASYVVLCSGNEAFLQFRVLKETVKTLQKSIRAGVEESRVSVFDEGRVARDVLCKNRSACNDKR